MASKEKITGRDEKMARRKQRRTISDEDGVSEIRLYSWEYFYDVVSSVGNLTDYAFRGQGSAHWELISKLDLLYVST